LLRENPASTPASRSPMRNLAALMRGGTQKYVSKAAGRGNRGSVLRWREGSDEVGSHSGTLHRSTGTALFSQSACHDTMCCFIKLYGCVWSQFLDLCVAVPVDDGALTPHDAHCRIKSRIPAGSRVLPPDYFSCCSHQWREAGNTSQAEAGSMRNQTVSKSKMSQHQHPSSTWTRHSLRV
jgi:hypothetical protein